MFDRVDASHLWRATGFVGARSSLVALAAMLTACGGGGGGGGGDGGGNPGDSYVVAPDVVFPGYASDAVWDERQQLLYLALPSGAGPNGNTIVALDPTRNRIVHSQFAGSDPSVLAMSDDGQYLYAGLRGSASVQRFRLPDLSPDLNFPLGEDRDAGPYYAVDLAVVPGSPRSVVVARGYYSDLTTVSSTIVFDDAVPRPQTLDRRDCSCSSLQWASTTQLLAANNQTSGLDFHDIHIDESGLRLNNSVRDAFSAFGARVHYSPDTRLLYGDDGIVFDPVAARRIGQVGTRGPMVPDTRRNRLYFVEMVGTIKIAAYDATTYQPLGQPRLFSEPAHPHRLIRWGRDGLALTTADGPVHLFGGSGTSSFESAVPKGTASQVLIPGTFNALAWNPLHQRLYASTSGASATSPSSILAIDPTTSAVTATRLIADEPGPLAVSDDGQFLYVGLKQAGSVQRLKLPTLEADISFALGSDEYYGPYVATDLKVAPGSPRTVAVVRTLPGIYPTGQGGIQVFDDATPRPTAALQRAGQIAWNPGGSTLYSTDSLNTALHVLAVDGTGSHIGQTYASAFVAPGRIQVDRGNGLIYHDSGRALDPFTGRPVANFRPRAYIGSELLVSDHSSNRVFVLSLSPTVYGGPNHRIDLYDLSRHTPMTTYPVTINIGIPSDFIRLSAGNFAILSYDGIYIVRLNLPT